MKGVVLCAGLGTRLAPLTDFVPKPLVPVANRPVLDLVLDRLAAAGVREVGVNLHHRSEILQAHLDRRQGTLPSLRTVFEPVILDTGGGIANFREWVESDGDDGVVVHNSDVVTDIDVAALLRAHRSSGAQATLALVDQARTNVVSLAPDGAVLDIRGRVIAAGQVGTAEDSRRWTFSGVYVLSRAFLRRLEPNRPSSVVDALVDAIREEPGSMRGVAQAPSVYWRDLGQVASYLDLHREILVSQRFRFPGLDGGPILVHASARVEGNARLEGFVAVGDHCHIGGHVRLSNCVVWPGTRLEGPFEASGAVILDSMVVAA